MEERAGERRCAAVPGAQIPSVSAVCAFFAVKYCEGVQTSGLTTVSSCTRAAPPIQETVSIFDGCSMIPSGMDSNLSQFISDIWRYKPVIIIVLIGGVIIFILSVVDTHRHRKKNQKKRHRPKDH
jgi:hypothetical protein